MIVSDHFLFQSTYTLKRLSQEDQPHTTYRDRRVSPESSLAKECVM